MDPQRDEEKDVLVNRELELRKRLLLKYKRNLITKLEENSEGEKSDELGPSSIVDATIAEVDADDNASLEKDAESDVEIEFEKADEEDQITISSKDDAEDSLSAKETSVAGSESEENATTTQVEESEGEIKSEGEASDTGSELSATELSDEPTNNKGPAKKKSKLFDICDFCPFISNIFILQARKRSTRKTKPQRQKTK